MIPTSLPSYYSLSSYNLDPDSIMLYFIYFLLYFFLFVGSHTWQYSEITPDSVLRDHPECAQGLCSAEDQILVSCVQAGIVPTVLLFLTPK